MKEIDYIVFSNSEILKFHRKIASKVKSLRMDRNLSQLDLALAIGHKSMSTIGKIEAGLESKHYNVEQLYKIAKVFEIDVSEIFI